MSNSFFGAMSRDRFVTVWPCITGESAFYDVVYGPRVDDEQPGDVRFSRADRVTAFEAAAFVLSEVGVGYGMTLDGVTRQIVEWRVDLDAQGREPVRGCGIPGCEASVCQ